MKSGIVYKVDGLRIMVYYLCELFVSDGVKRQSPRIIGVHVGLERNTRETGEENIRKLT